MTKTLGLDLGTNSIGWAIIINGIIKEMGVRIFPEGVENLGQGEGREKSKNAKRTDHRSTRRQYFRRKIRKSRLLNLLKENDLRPNIQLDSEEMKEWFRMPPYEIRHRALTEKVSLFELGRAFYHMAQRRGFQSNSRSAATKEDTAIFQTKDGLTGINDTRALIQNSKSGTLGGALKTNILDKYEPGEKTARRRRTERKMYIDEFEKIWTSQARFHPELTNDLKTKIGGRKRDGYSDDGVLFYQRPLRSQKSKIGKCSFEPTKTKCPMSHPKFEYFRTWQFINTIECGGERLNAVERKKVLELFEKKERVKFKDIRRKLKLLDDEYKFNYPDDETRPGCVTVYKLSNRKCFGDDWFTFDDKKQDQIWHIFRFFDDKEKLKNYAIEKWGFDEERAVHASKLYFKDGYANLSRKAILNILPFLDRDGEGYDYDIAVALGGVKNAFGRLWEDLDKEDSDFIHDNIPDVVRKRLSGGYADELKEILALKFNFAEPQFKKLYHHSASIDAEKILPKLPVGPDADREITQVRNPIVITALFELRKLVNELSDKYEKFDTIKIELGRDLKINKAQRQRIRRENKEREKNHLRIVKELERYKERPTHDNILKYKLWEECKEICPYTGLEINVNQLFDGTFEIEHIWPKSKTGDDSYLNLTLCEASVNARKGNRIPYDYFIQEEGEAKFLEFKDRVQKIFFDTKEFPNRYKKFKRLVAEKLNVDFKNRQLNDTRFISKEAKNYLKKICPDVMVLSGQATAKLRHHWGLNSVISHDNKAKNRDDHRHHAIDALVAACTDLGVVQKLSKWNRYKKELNEGDVNPPWEDFRFDAINAVNNILISHKKSNRVLTTRHYKTKKDGKIYVNKGQAARGQLHKETVYGKRKAPKQKTDGFHIRKSLETLTKVKQIQKIADERIRNLILDYLESGDWLKPNGDIKPGAFFEKNPDGGRPKPLVFIPPNPKKKDGKPIPIFKVRIREEIGNAEQLKDDLNQWVNPRNNHHILIYRNEEGTMKEDVVTLWKAAERKRNKMPVFQLPPDGAEIIETLEINDMFLLDLPDDEIDFENPNPRILSQHLYRVQKLSSMYYTFRHHLASTLDYSEDEKRITSFKKWEELNPIKVFISAGGKIRFSQKREI